MSRVAGYLLGWCFDGAVFTPFICFSPQIKRLLFEHVIVLYTAHLPVECKVESAIQSRLLPTNFDYGYIRGGSRLTFNGMSCGRDDVDAPLHRVVEWATGAVALTNSRSSQSPDVRWLLFLSYRVPRPAR
jgi:hypothetical protein